MKEIFSVDLNSNQIDGEKFITSVISPELSQKQDEHLERINDFEKKGALPAWQSTIKKVFAIIAFFFTVIFFGQLITGGADLAKSVSESKFELIIAIIFWIDFAVISIYHKRKSKRLYDEALLNELVKEGERLHEECLQALGVSKKAIPIDVFVTAYEKNGEKKKKASPFFSYINNAMLVFDEGEYLCFSDLSICCKIKKNAFVQVEHITKNTSFVGWNKPEEYRSNEYKQYKIRPNSYGVFFVKNCLKLVFQDEGEQYCIILPPYEEQTIGKFIKI